MWWISDMWRILDFLLYMLIDNWVIRSFQVLYFSFIFFKHEL